MLFSWFPGPLPPLQVSLVGPEKGQSPVWGQLPPCSLLSSTGLEEGPPSWRMRKRVSCPFNFLAGKASRLQKQRFNLNSNSASIHRAALSRGLIKGFNGLKGPVTCGRGGRRPTGSAWGAQQLRAEAQPCEWENWCPHGALPKEIKGPARPRCAEGLALGRAARGLRSPSPRARARPLAGPLAGGSCSPCPQLPWFGVRGRSLNFDRASSLPLSHNQ